MKLTDKIKIRILRNFAEYDDFLFIGTYIQRRIELADYIQDVSSAEKLCEVSCMPQIKRNEASFRNSIRAAVRGLWRGDLALTGFVDSMSSTLRRELRAAWLSGAAECNIAEDELTPAETIRQANFIQAQIGYVLNFGNDIEANSKKNGGKLGPLLERSNLWVARAREAKTIGAAMACADEKRMWQIGPTEEHCKSCLGLNGRVYRYSVWLQNDAFPKSQKLECKGFNCLCELVASTEKITPGKFPSKLVG